MLRCYERYVNDYQENATIPRTGVDSSQGRGTKRRRNEGWTVFGRDKGMGRYGGAFLRRFQLFGIGYPGRIPAQAEQPSG